LFVKIDKNHKGMTKDEILGLAGSEKHLKKTLLTISVYVYPIFMVKCNSIFFFEY